MNKRVMKHPGPNLGAGHGGADKAAETVMFGFWVFLMSDTILFGMVFATHITSVDATVGGPGPRELYDIRSVFVETLLLLASSFTFGVASLALKYKHDMVRLISWMVLTLVLGLAFLGLELHDFATMFAKGAVPSRSGFLSAFFDLLPLHGLHVLAGCLWLVALFWLFLDLIWIAIFSVVYLGGLA